MKTTYFNQAKTSSKILIQIDLDDGKKKQIMASSPSMATI